MNAKLIRSLPLVLVLSGSLAAQEQARIPSVRATGEGTASASPDRALINIGVVTQAATAQEAAAGNAKQLAQVLAELKQALPSSAEIRTLGYSLNPDYRQGPNQAPRITGYTASNTVHITLDDLKAVSKAIDAATRTGANRINSLQFTVKNDQALRTEALKEATQKARASAEAMASSVGARILRVLSIEEGGPGRVVPIMMREQMGMAADVSTPVEPGTIDVRATVMLTAEIAQ